MRDCVFPVSHLASSPSRLSCLQGLADKRERYYDSQNIGCYMFSINEEAIIDATMRGNAARFINHSCDV